MTGRDTASWNTYSLSDFGSYTNNRRAGWGYDADGRNTTIDTRTNTFDASGQKIQMSAQSQFNNFTFTIDQASAYDGDGQNVREINTRSNSPNYVVTTYYLRSSVLGGIIEELNGSGQKIAGYVYYAGGRLLATQTPGSIAWRHVTPAGTGKYDTYSGLSYAGRVELDPTGADVGLTSPPPPDTGGGDGDVGSGHFGGLKSELTSDIFNPAGGCVVDGHSENCGIAMGMVNFGTGNRSGLLEVGANTGQALANSVMLSASPEAIFAPAGNDIAGITPGDDSSETRQVGDTRYSQDAEGNWTASMTVAPARITGIASSAMGLNNSIPLRALTPQDPNLIKTNHAFGDAARAIDQKKGKKKDPCADFFTKGSSLESITKIFKNFWDSATYAPNLAAVAGTKNSGLGMAATLRLGQAFFADDDTTPGTDLSFSRANNLFLTNAYQLTPRQNRAFTILHEFAHALGLIPSDRDNPSQSLKNDATIFEHCGAVLNTLPLID